MRVSFPLRYELRNGAKHASGKINKILVVEPAGDDLQIVAVNERKASELKNGKLSLSSCLNPSA